MTKYTIYVIKQDYAPANMRYAAAFHPLDEGDSWPTGEGESADEAIHDLIENHDCPWDKP